MPQEIAAALAKQKVEFDKFDWERAFIFPHEDGSHGPLTLGVFKDPRNPQLIAMLCTNSDHIANMEVASNIPAMYDQMCNGLCRLEWFPLIWVNNLDEVVPAMKIVLAKAKEIAQEQLPDYDFPFDKWAGAIWDIYDDFATEDSDVTGYLMDCKTSLLSRVG